MVEEIYKRTSVRDFLDKEVEQEKIIEIIRAGMQAPSAKNQQPWETYVVTDKKTINELSKVSPYSKFASGAKVIIVPCYKKECTEPDYSLIDLAIFTENMWLETETLGLGGCMIGIAPVKERENKVNKILNLDNTISAFCLFPVGYPEKRHKQQNRFKNERIHFIY